MIETGWTWQDYINAPDEVVHAMLVLMSARAEYSRSNG